MSLLVFSANYLIFIFPAVWLYFLIRREYRLVLHAVLAVSLTSAVSWLIKNFFYLPRPFITTGTHPAINYLMDGSFPSNHAAFSFAAAVSMYFYHRRLGLLLLLVAAVIAVARVESGVHSVIDITGGAILGTFFALTTYHSK